MNRLPVAFDSLFPQRRHFGLLQVARAVLLFFNAFVAACASGSPSRRAMLVVILTCMLSAGYGFTSPTQDDSTQILQHGEQLFRRHCSACHSVHREVVGPMLASITKKRSQAWLLRFIRNSEEVINSGDPYARHMMDAFNNQVMPTFPMLSQQDIQSILVYIERESLVQVDETPVHDRITVKSDSSILRGRMLFRDQCSSCHFIHYEGRYAPALGSVSKRLPREWLIPFIQNSQKVIRGGDPYAQELFDRYHKRVMVPMEFLTEDDITDILNYIAFSSTTEVPTVAPEQRAQNPVVSAEAEPTGEVADKKTGPAFSLQGLSWVLITIFTILTIVAIIGTGFAFRTLRSLWRKK
ncbi:c-type cytochrome [Parachryseolinea silvisoli]|uniref:c-type cytochrome n=1 Tax=Parachryseolinea silvisoli TaxID=2873601 RepID=UPI002265A58E|nr:cytochrome c [Parachryseolinea silvisoli]MCD9014091.1 cytochrome c [Parachryseolinea silvisoli]